MLNSDEKHLKYIRFMDKLYIKRLFYWESAHLVLTLDVTIFQLDERSAVADQKGQQEQ